MISRVQIVERALMHLGHREVTPNHSPLIDGWIERCGLDPTEHDYPWCAAFASWCIEERLPSHVGTVSPQKVASAGVLRLASLFPSTRKPLPGDLMWFPTGKGSGHCGIVEDADEERGLIIEGNHNNEIARVIRLHSEVNYASTRGLGGGAVYHHPPDAWPPARLVHAQRAGTR